MSGPNLEDIVLGCSVRIHGMGDELRNMAVQFEQLAKELDPRTQDEMFRTLPATHPASRLRYLAYSARRAYEALA